MDAKSTEEARGDRRAEPARPFSVTSDRLIGNCDAPVSPPLELSQAAGLVRLAALARAGKSSCFERGGA
jgi:hypothetical protein